MIGIAKFGVAACFVAAVLAMASTTFVYVMSLQSLPNATFDAYPYFNKSATNTTIVMNWTGPANLSVESFYNNTGFNVSNSSRNYIIGIFWQNDSSFYGLNSYDNLTPATYDRCFIGGKYMGFTAKNNVTGTHGTANLTNATAGYNSTVFNLSYYPICPPGAYRGNFSVVEAYNSSVYVNLTASILIPISTQNTLNATAWNYTGFAHGQMPPNASYYHSYYFNLTELVNATGLTINISGFSQRMGMFLFYGNGTPMMQCENSTSCEIPFIQLNNVTDFPQETGNMTELRVYGNFSPAGMQTYRINMYYSTINVSDQNGNKSVSLLDFSELPPNNGSKSMNFTLTNAGGKNLSDINQTVDFYWIRRWSNLIADQAQNATYSNLSIIVPNFTTTIEATLEWRNTSGYPNMTDWNLFLIDPRGNIVANSTNGFFNSNLSNATATERITYSGAGIFNTSNVGIWNISVNSTTFPFSNVSIYSVTVKIRFNATGSNSWVKTNFTEAYPYNQLSRSGLENSSRYVRVNITVPMTEVLNGSYEGFIQYWNSDLSLGGWKVRLPIRFQVSAPMLVINNSIYNTTVRILENIGMFRNRSANITFSNLGSSFIYSLKNSSNLTHGSSFMNFTIIDSWLNYSGGVVQSNENRSININITINTTSTANTQGVYTGYIIFNVTQNNTNNISIHNIFNINMEVNMTGNLAANMTEYLGYGGLHNPFVNLTNQTENITMLINVSLQNGTVISDNNYQMNESNFTSITITETNVTTFARSLSSIRPGRINVCGADGFCVVNATLPNGTPGGRYTLSAHVQWNSTMHTDLSPYVLTGDALLAPLTVWAPGIKIGALNGSLDISMGEYEDRSINVTATNYGPQSASSVGIVAINNTCSYVVVNATSLSGTVNGTCSLSGVTANNHFTVTSIGGNGSVCWMLFKLHSINVSGAKSCSAGSINISAYGVPFFNYIDTPTVSISDTDGGSGGTSSSSSGSSTTTSYTYNRSVRIMSYNSAYTAKLGENISATVTAKNTGNITSIVWLTATTNNSAITTAVGPSFNSLGAGATGTYTVYMNVSNASRIGLSAGTFKAYVEGYTDTWYDTEPFDFTVESTPERNAEINASFANYTAQLQNLTNIFNAIKASGLADIGNLTRVGELLNASSGIAQSIKDAINSSNYAVAESLIVDLAGRLGRIREELATLESSKAAGEQKFLGDLYVWVVTGLVIAGAAGVVIYMLMPPKQGFRRIKGLGIRKKEKQKKPEKKEKESELEKIKQHILRKGGGKKSSRNKKSGSTADYAELSKGKLDYMTAKYAEGYERALNGRGGIAGRLKSVFKRREQKQERLSDFSKKK